jgi:hypothetical protein
METHHSDPIACRAPTKVTIGLHLRDQLIAAEGAPELDKREGAHQLGRLRDILDAARLPGNDVKDVTKRC